MRSENSYDSASVTQWLLETEALEFLQSLAGAPVDALLAENAGLAAGRHHRLTVVTAGPAAPSGLRPRR